ncbi:M57 family metalloprotease [Nocardioides pinisoli]|uniref:M57 family metalloprotease n=1 Tax=Nocardioides pinisoli TaxID=2950279 RepID=A0ABT1KZ11_9ACTN|nr:M57 family metalloprotease [Nocardioides pinisoli]MCP3422847.1 M57 family metalloprotease [Nocardioides pinisoli]
MSVRTLLQTATAVIAAGALASSLAPVATAAPARDRAVPTFGQFQSTTYRDTAGQYVVNGDETVIDTQQLQGYYDEMLAAYEREVEGGASSELIINRVYGRDDKWSATTARNLTYCVSNNFGSQKTNIVNAMANGAYQWESASSGVNFTYVPSQDANCRTSNNAVLFSVEPTYTTQYIARAFFPSSPDSQRNVLVNAGSLMNSGSWTPGNIMAHELGHALGFRHEHTRPEAGTCFEDNNWRPLTAYDAASIMHYPQCNGSSSDLSMTGTDRAGVRSVYGS